MIFPLSPSTDILMAKASNEALRNPIPHQLTNKKIANGNKKILGLMNASTIRLKTSINPPKIINGFLPNLIK